jgi:hypothetical protein
MVETLTTWVVLLSLFILVLGAITLYVWLSNPAHGECKNCGGSGQTVVRGTNGNIQVRCPLCSE